MMNKQLEKPFEYLRRKKETGNEEGKKFESEIVNNWYKARAFVLSKLEKIAFEPNDSSHLHIMIKGDNPLMLSVVRQVALTTHYLNFDEENEEEEKRKRTVITLESSKKINEIIYELKKEEYLNNLLDYCKYSTNEGTFNKDSYIDIEFRIVNKLPNEDVGNPNELVFKEEDVISFCELKTKEELYNIDTRKAQYAGRTYDLAKLIENLPAENIHDAVRYTLALNTFQYNKLQEPLGSLIEESKWNKDQIKVKNGLSNIFCADCFDSKVKSIELCRKDKKQKYSLLWAENNEFLCKSEHARWVVEKLIMGFRPLNDNERIDDEKLSPYEKKRELYRDNLKNDTEKLAHIDLCSYTNLRRVNPEHMKYDSFLMLAIPLIYETLQNENNIIR